jgi:hypothetical protein
MQATQPNSIFVIPMDINTPQQPTTNEEEKN